MASPSQVQKEEDTGNFFDLLQISKVPHSCTEEEWQAQIVPGYRWDPTPYDLIVFYLANTLLNRTLPITNLVKEVEVFKINPNMLSNGDFKHGNNHNEAFYFVVLEKM